MTASDHSAHQPSATNRPIESDADFGAQQETPEIDLDAEYTTDPDDFLPAPASGATTPAPAAGREQADEWTAGSLRWDPEDYRAAGIEGPGADKLADSGVAPLVAAARGYQWVDNDTVKAAAPSMGIVTFNSKQGRNLRDLAALDGALVLPWHRPDAARRSSRTGVRPMPAAIQMRPTNPRSHPNGKVAKYEFLAGTTVILDINPGTPGEWLEMAPSISGGEGLGTPTVLFTEGIIKGDSAVSAMLLAAGATRADLSYDDPSVDALARLRGALASIPTADRVLVVSIGGVSNWHSNPEWSDMNLKHRKALLAFDGDVATNPNVHREASGVWNKLTAIKAHPVLVDLMVTGGDAGELRPVGVDDYLNGVGTWASLLTRLRTELPPSPNSQDRATKGDLRFNLESLTAQEWCPTDGDRAGYWHDQFAMIGRVVKTDTKRVVSGPELDTGMLSAADAWSEASVEVELSWMDRGAVCSATVTGPAEILAEDPKAWHRKTVGALVPSTALGHPDWPPTPSWLREVKRHRGDERIDSTSFQHMGWVPTEGPPVFIAGSAVVGADGFCEAVIPGVTEDLLKGASKFGVIDPGSDEAARAAVKEVLAAFDNHAWLDKRIGAAILGAALRPVVPMRPETTLYVYGPAGGGKSMTAAAAMTFWSAYPGAFNRKSMPGAGTDTEAATEACLARTMMWVMDDIPPSTSKQAADATAAKVESLIRSVFQDVGKRRMTATMTSRETLRPRALFILTAENESQIASIRERCVIVPVEGASLGTPAQTDRIEQNGLSGLHAKVSFLAVRNLARNAQERGWANEVTWWKDKRRSITADVEAFLGSASDRRAAGVAADCALGLWVLANLAEDLGMDPECLKAISMVDWVASLVRDGASAQKKATPGHNIISAVRNLLSSGRGHIVSLENPGAPPAVGDDSALLNHQLGWTAGPMGEIRPMGTSIGYLIHDKQNEPVLLLEPMVAFTEAQRLYPALLPAGTSAATVWGSVWDKGLAHTRQWTRQPASHKGGGRRNTIRVSGASGVPVGLHTVLGHSDDGT